MRAGSLKTVLDLRLLAALVVPLALGGCASDLNTGEPQAYQASPKITKVTQAALLPDGGVADAPPGWTCSDEAYYGFNGCDCGCGIPDPDCNSSGAEVCDTCNISGSCSEFYYGEAYDTGFGCPGVIDSSDNSVCFDAPPLEWTCDAARYGTGNACDCGCGVADPDCEGSSVESCDTCNAGGSCGQDYSYYGTSYFGDPCGTIDPIDNAVCGWKCDEDYFDDGPCDCGCGLTDADCSDDTVASCDYCDGDGPGSCAVSCAEINPEDNSVCGGPGVPGEWTCDPGTFYNPGSGNCDCGCGVEDPDCEDSNVASCDTCGNQGSCAELWGCQLIEEASNSVCSEGTGWTCNPSYFGDGPCDCGCGIVDIDCDDETVASCDYCDGDGEGSCTTVSCADIDPENNAECDGDGVPAGWTCDPSLYFNPGISGCDCGCGVVDPDCSDSTAASCNDCDLEGGCSEGGCDDINPGDNAVCSGAPGEWTCSSESYGSEDGCHCGCGIPDPDCTDGTVDSCDYCGAGDSGSCAVSCADIDPADNTSCDGPGVPPAWDCDPALYFNPVFSGCECGCGEVDPDCNDATVFSCDSCVAEGSCAGSCDDIEDSDNAVCGEVTNCAGQPVGTPCADEDPCTGGEVCSGDQGGGPDGGVVPGTCVATVNLCNSCGTLAVPLNNGLPCGGEPSECSFQSTCSDGACVDNFKPETADCGGIVDPNGCVNQDKCDGLGVCEDKGNKDPDLECGDQSDSECTHPDTCDGNGVCQPNDEPPQTDCNGLVEEFGCLNQDKCGSGPLAGTCVDNGFRPALDNCGGPAGAIETECDLPNTCDENGVCQRNQVEAGTACGDRTDRACDNPDTCDGLGACAPNHEASTTICRSDEGECDVAESCGESIDECPEDQFEPSGVSCGDTSESTCDHADTCDGLGLCQDNLEPAATTVCRPGVGLCDVAELCDGDGACPADAFAPEFTPCDGPGQPTAIGPSSCDNPDTCDATGTCLPRHEPTTTLCRPPGTTIGVDAACDVAEFCNGSGSCNPDVFQPAATSCGNTSDSDCDNPDSCNATGQCQANNELPSYVCRTDAGACDVAETCGASTGACPENLFEAEFTACGDPTDRDCDNPDSCDSSGTCQARNEGSAHVCRPDAGECDVAETCGASVTACPADAFEPSGWTCGNTSSSVCDRADSCDGLGTCQANPEPITTSCRAAGTNVDTACDVAEFCNGTGSCPADLFKPAASACGDSSDTVCDNPDTCNALGFCQVNNEPSTTVCRGDAGQCDVQETCDGSGSCPADTYEPSGTNCGTGPEACSDQDTCDGGGVCQTNHKSSDTVCRGIGDGGANVQCDIAETCGASVTSCPADLFVAPLTPCGDQTVPTGFDTGCSAPNSCDATGQCNPRNAPTTQDCGDTGTQCRNQDKCSGNGTCEDKGFVASGVSCGSGTDTDCSNPDTCDGSGTCNPRNEGPTIDCGTHNECENQDKCDNFGGNCVDNGFRPLNAPCGDPSNTTCTDPDTCNGAGTCQPHNASDGTDCGDSGTQCRNQDKCGSGVCVDNGFVAAATPCGSGVDTVCSNPDSCDGSGTCSPNNEPNTAICRPAGGLCDVAELCNNGTCPVADLKQATGFVCRGTGGNDCDLAEVCDGSTNACPADVLVAAGVGCGSNSDTTCDNPDTCNGSGTCLTNVEPDTLPCRGAAGVCDVAENCDGAGACPSDAKVPTGTACGSGADTDCDNPDTCDGSSPACQANNEASSFVCRSATGVCDVAETCGASTGACPGDDVQPNGSACGDSTDRDCDNPDTCNGSSKDCQVNNEPSKHTCRAAAGVCDVAETCGGSTDACPGDVKVAADTACGDGTDRDCDNPDTCNGTSPNCQANNEAPSFVCRGAAGVCDAAETCGGSNTACPADLKVAASTACGDGTDRDCDNPDTCNGVANDCQANNELPTFTCRASGGVCDIAETCGGSNTACPGDAVQPNNTPCGSSADSVCDNPDTCNGSAKDCQANNEPTTTTCGDTGTECTNQDFCSGTGTCAEFGHKIAGTSCGSASDTDCDNADSCNGSGTCLVNNEPPTTNCGDTGTECTNQDKCSGSGSCTDNGFKAALTACGDPTDRDCDNPDSCNGSGTCLNRNEASGFTCRNSAGACDVAETCGLSTTACPSDAVRPNGFACGSSADSQCDNPDTCNGSSVDCQVNNEPNTVNCGDTGTDCTNQDKCDGSGACTDNGYQSAGTGCGDDTDTECDDADTCNGTGTCLQNFVAANTACGSSSNTDCDNPDSCDGSGACQVNHEVSGFSCRPAVDDCDVAETCDGTGANCPTDALATAGTECREAADACDVAETCDGATDSCPTDDLAVEGTECRGAAGACDVVETCSGSSVACPADVVAASGDVCRAASGECDVDETCNGTSTACPSDAFEPSGTACGNATDTDCDDPDTCNATGSCRSNVEPAGTACGDDTSNECTSADTCNGSGVCNLNNATNGTSCEDEGTCSVGVCQLPEVDAGSDAGSDA
ncbi:MAG TPA: hypothetical protein VHO25_12815, partial [Polyangiaceae bacterium]|nr:hypothetical protein [Polyangiaceae bacterium]